MNSLHQKYWDFRSRLYRLHLRWPVLGWITRKEHQATDDMIRKWHQQGTDHPILSAGCGILRFENIDDDQSSVYLDFSMEMLSRNRDQHGILPYVQADAQFTPFSDDSFSLILAEGLTEMLDHPVQWIQEMKRILRTDGIIVFSSAPGHLLNHLRLPFNPGITFRPAVWWKQEMEKEGMVFLDHKRLLLQDILVFKKPF